MSYRTFSTLNGSEKAFVIGLLVWIALQLSRAIALTLINEINAGAESAAWLYPAYLDLFAVVCAPPLIWAILKRPGLLTWAAVLVYFTVSIVDHAGNLVTTSYVGPPSIAEGMNPYLIPVIQTALDALFCVLLFVPAFRRVFFDVERSQA